MPHRDRGFTLAEVMIAMTVLITVLVISTSLLFSMRGFAVRQQMFAEPRQAGRQAVEYVAENIRQAGVIGRVAPGFEGVIVPYVNGVQTMWNNCQTATYADLNTDIMCIMRPQGSSAYQVAAGPAAQGNQTLTVSYSEGCPDNASNRSMFLDETQAWNGNHTVVIVDSKGALLLDNLTWNLANPISTCAGTAPTYAGSTLSLAGNVYALYGGAAHAALVEPCYVSAASFLTLRVKNGRLQQKFGWLDINNVDDGFVDLLENVVDLQFSFFMRNGAIYNNTHNNVGPTNPMPTVNNIPLDPNAGDSLSCSNVLGVGVYMVTRSAAEAPLTMRRPLAFPLTADRWVPPPAILPGTTLRQDRMFYYQGYANAFVRNRMLGF